MLQHLAYAAILIGLFPSPLRASQLEIPVDNTRVFSAPDVHSQVLTVLRKGAVVPVSDKYQSPSFRLVLVSVGGKNLRGYISNADLRSAMIRRKRSEPKAPSLVNKTAFGVFGGLNYQYQGARNYQDAPNNASASISALGGLGYDIFGLVAFEVSDDIVVEIFSGYKTTYVKGSSQYNLNNVPAAATNTYLRDNFFTLGGQIKFYSSAVSRFWFGGGFQWDHAISGTLQFDPNPASSLSGSDLPNFILLFGSIGYDFPLSQNIFLTPELHLGAVINSTPIIFEGAGLVGIRYAL